MADLTLAFAENYALWDESQHPRVPAGSADGGQFTSGDAGQASFEAPTPHGAYNRPHPIHTGDIDRAVHLILTGKVVELDDVRQVHTVIKRLADIAQEAAKLGKKAPDYNLCKVSVKGTNIFCASIVHHIGNEYFPEGIPRIRMPQFKGEAMPGSPADKLARDRNGEVDSSEAFKDHLKQLGIPFELKRVPSAKLRASQAELVGPKVAGMMTSTTYDPGRIPIFTTSDNYVVDGHHNWAAAVGRDARDGKLGDHHINVYEVQAPIAEVLHLANDFTKKFGIKPKAAGKGAKALAEFYALSAESQKRKKLPLLTGSAKTSAQTATDRLLASARAEALRLRRAGWEDDEIEDALKIHMGELTDGDITKLANMEVNEAFSLGRTAAASELKDQIQTAIYSAILDNNVCDVCEKLDGREFNVDSDEYEENMPPNSNCKGGDQCRCTYIYVLDPEADGKGLSEIALWDESEPRDDHGRWTRNGASTSGGGKKLALVSPKQAVKAMHSKRPVTIHATDLREMYKEAIKSPVALDLTHVTVDGHDIFGNSLGIKRTDMPQIPRDHQEAFIDWLHESGTGVSRESVTPTRLRPVQGEIDARRVGKKLNELVHDEPVRPIFVSKDNFVLDGHHRWAAVASLAAIVPKQKVKIPVMRIMQDHQKALASMNRYGKLNKINRESIHEQIAAHEWWAFDNEDDDQFEAYRFGGDFDESKHPRVPAGSADGGQFTSGGGGESTPEAAPSAQATSAPTEAPAASEEKRLVDLPDDTPVDGDYPVHVSGEYSSDDEEDSGDDDWSPSDEDIWNNVSSTGEREARGKFFEETMDNDSYGSDAYESASNDMQSELRRDKDALKEIATEVSTDIADELKGDPRFTSETPLMAKAGMPDVHLTLDPKSFEYTPTETSTGWPTPELNIDALRTVSGQELTDSQKEVVSGLWADKFNDAYDAKWNEITESDAFIESRDNYESEAMQQAWDDLSNEDRVRYLSDRERERAMERAYEDRPEPEPRRISHQTGSSSGAKGVYADASDYLGINVENMTRAMGRMARGFSAEGSTKVSWTGRSLEIEMRAGTLGATITRTVTKNPDDTLNVHHDWFALPREAQGQGIASRMLEDSIKIYDRYKVGSLNTLANIDVGGYAWAKLGFKAENPGAFMELIESRYNEYGRDNYYKEYARATGGRDWKDPVVKKEADANMNDIISKGGAAGNNAPNVVANMPGGKGLMLNTSWPGYVDFKGTYKPMFTKIVHEEAAKKKKKA